MTIIIDLGDPCRPIGSSDPDLGHAGLGIGDKYYDCGPNGSKCWSGETDSLPTMESKIVKHPNSKGAGVIAIEVCACKVRAEFAENYYKYINKNAPDYSLIGCSAALCGALGGGIQMGTESPYSLAIQLTNDELPILGSIIDNRPKSDCGKDKGSPGNVRIIRRPTDSP